MVGWQEKLFSQVHFILNPSDDWKLLLWGPMLAKYKKQGENLGVKCYWLNISVSVRDGII